MVVKMGWILGRLVNISVYKISIRDKSLDHGITRQVVEKMPELSQANNLIYCMVLSYSGLPGPRRKKEDTESNNPNL